MLSPVSAADWSAIDSWWSSYEQDQPIILGPSASRRLPDVATEGHWESVEALWDAFEAGQEVLFAPQHSRDLTADSKAGAWATVDDFWDSYADQQQAELQELQDLMSELREAWSAGASRFEDDPLSANWRSESQFEGPVRTTIREEDWSQWLAHLLRTSSGPFASELLDTPDRPPASVRREVVFFGDDVQRRVDILVEYEDLGVSIEVKHGDEHYGKTPQTADLVERHDRREWSHVLLLQKDKRSRLQQTFGDRLDRSETGPATIRSEEYPDVAVRYWRDVSRTLRRMLLDGRESDNHWEASAYLFVTLIEQRILGLHSFAFVEPGTTGSAPTAPGTDLHRLVVAEPHEQITYLRDVLQEDHTNE